MSNSSRQLYSLIFSDFPKQEKNNKKIYKILILFINTLLTLNTFKKYFQKAVSGLFATHCLIPSILPTWFTILFNI